LLRHKKSDAKTGINYKPCMAILDATAESEEAVQTTIGETKLAKKAPIICLSPLCVALSGGKGHKIPVSKKCIHNPKHPNYVLLPTR